MKITKTAIRDDLILLRFQTQYQLASTFLRVQEHHESSAFKRRIFSLEEYMDWYAARFGAFTYYEDWSGFNVPSSAFDPFYDGRFDPLSRKERLLLDVLRDQRRPYYVIAVAAAVDLRHEIAHALDFTVPEYRRAIRRAMRGFDTSSLRRQLSKLGYHRSVLSTEVQAYLIAPAGTLGRSGRALDPLRKKLRAIFRTHAAGLPLSV